MTEKRKPPQTCIIPADEPWDHPKSSRRTNPVDIHIGKKDLSPRDVNVVADDEYYGQLDKFREYATKNSESLKPNRDGYK